MRAHVRFQPPGVNDQGEQGSTAGVANYGLSLLAQLKRRCAADTFDFVIVTYNMKNIAGAVSMSAEVAKQLVLLKFVRSNKDAYKPYVK